VAVSVSGRVLSLLHVASTVPNQLDFLCQLLHDFHQRLRIPHRGTVAKRGHLAGTGKGTTTTLVAKQRTSQSSIWRAVNFNIGKLFVAILPTKQRRLSAVCRGTEKMHGTVPTGLQNGKLFDRSDF